MNHSCDVSIVATAHRPKNWMRVYNSIITDLNFEVIFVAPNKAKAELPNNFKFIRSKVKPTQCVEIALREARGKYVMIFADDLVMETPFGLDLLFTRQEEIDNQFSIASCRYKYHGQIEPDSRLRFIDGDENSPIVPLSGLMHRSAIEKIGGIDKRFIAVSYDLDLAMRFHKEGGNVYLNDVFVHELEELRGASRLFNENWIPDRELLNSLWIKNGKFSKNRLDSLNPFVQVGIKKRSQGPRGHWRGQGNYLQELLTNLPWLIKRYRMLLTERIKY
jgi:hypothetical protein